MYEGNATNLTTGTGTVAAAPLIFHVPLSRSAVSYTHLDVYKRQNTYLSVGLQLLE